MDAVVGMAEAGTASGTRDTLLHGLRVVCLTGTCSPGPILAVLHALGAQTIAISEIRREPQEERSSAGQFSSPGLSLLIDMKSDAGKEIVLRIVRTTDVLLVRTGDDDAVSRHLSPEQFAKSNPGLVIIRVPRSVSRPDEASKIDADVQTDSGAWEVGVLLAGLWYRDRNNGKGADLVVDDRLSASHVAQDVPHNRGTQAQIDVEHLLWSVDFSATETREMIAARVIRLKGGV